MKIEEKDEAQEEKKFVRKGKRSTTLIEKSKLGKKLIATEMNVQLKQEALIIQEKGNPSKKYKPTSIFYISVYYNIINYMFYWKLRNTITDLDWLLSFELEQKKGLKYEN